MKRKFKVEIIVENDQPTLAMGLQEAKKSIQSLGLKANDIKPVKGIRTLAQNRALHLFFTQLSEELQNHGLTMKDILREGFEYPATPYSIKEFVWRPTQKAMFGKKSTTELFKTEEIEKVYDVICKAISERTNGMIDFPSFPSIETLMLEEEGKLL